MWMQPEFCKQKNCMYKCDVCPFNVMEEIQFNLQVSKDILLYIIVITVTEYFISQLYFFYSHYLQS